MQSSHTYIIRENQIYQTIAMSIVRYGFWTIYGFGLKTHYHCIVILQYSMVKFFHGYITDCPYIVCTLFWLRKLEL